MQAISSLPKVLEEMEDLHKDNYRSLYLEYKEKVRTFILSVNNEVSRLIDRYEQEIKQLKQQNERLKVQCIPISPIRVKPTPKLIPSTNLDLMQTAKSTIFNPFSTAEEGRFSAVLGKYKDKEDNNFPVQLINPQPGEDAQYAQGKSMFETKMKRKKQREEELRHFLQTGRKSMNATTDRFLAVIQRQDDRQDQSNNENEKDRDRSDSSISSKRNDSSGHNQSLGSLCKSLENSYISKKVRKQKSKRNDQVKDEQKRKKQQEQQLAKMLKNKGIKSLLQRLRDNAQSPNKVPETIKMSKLMACGPTLGSTFSPKKANFTHNKAEQSTIDRKRKNSKVLINPVPVDIAKKNQATRKYSSELPLSSQKKMPQSILKQSKILGRSLSGISAIDFAEE